MLALNKLAKLIVTVTVLIVATCHVSDILHAETFKILDEAFK